MGRFGRLRTYVTDPRCVRLRVSRNEYRVYRLSSTLDSYFWHGPEVDRRGTLAEYLQPCNATFGPFVPD